MTSVAFCVDQLFYDAPGGIGTYVRELVPAMASAARPPEIVLFHSRFPADQPPEGWMGAFPRHPLPDPIWRLYPSWDLAGRPALPPALQALDLLHAPSPVAVPPPAPGQRLVVTVHDLAFRRYPRLFPARWLALFRLGTRRAARAADAILVPSHGTARDLRRYEPVDPRRIHVVPLAADPSTVAGDAADVLEGHAIRGPYILFVGTLEPRKNAEGLIRAYRRAVDAEGLPHALVLAGPPGWRAERTLEQARAPGPGTVVVTGPLGSGALDALYRGADLFVYPSLYEGFGLPVLEAMARGVPVVTSRTSSIPEVAGEAAITVDPRSEAELAAAIRRVLEDPAEAERLAKAGAARARLFSWERTAERTLEVYASLLN